MCEVCDEVRQRNWDEIRDLLNFNRAHTLQGPLSQEIHNSLDEYEDEHGPIDDKCRQSRIDAVRAEMIACRCAIIAAYSPGTEYHNEPLYKTLGAWTVEIMQQENPLLAALTEIFPNIVVTATDADLDADADADE